MDGELKYIHVAWIPAIPAGMTDLCITMSARRPHPGFAGMGFSFFLDGVRCDIWRSGGLPIGETALRANLRWWVRRRVG